MPYHYLEDIATADVAFEAWGSTLEEMFVASADATVNVMVRDLNTVAAETTRTIRVEADAVDMLLFNFLQELVFYKDAETLLLRVPAVAIEQQDGCFTLHTEAQGEPLNPDKHELIVDVKAVTLYRFEVKQTPRGWEAMVILDI
jgi:SHS2 domain-containing protein